MYGWPWIAREMPRLLYSRSEPHGQPLSVLVTDSLLLGHNRYGKPGNSWKCPAMPVMMMVMRNNFLYELEEKEFHPRRMKLWRKARARSPSVFSSGNNSSLSLTRIAPDASAPTSFLSYSLGRLVWERSNQFQIMELNETRFKNMAFPVFRGPTTLELLLFER